MLTGKVAVVTGSTSGIGMSYAKALAAEGADLLINGFGDRAEIDAFRTELEAEHGINTVYHGADLTRPDEIVDMIDTANRDLGRVDILVHNAGVQHTDRVEDFPAEKWDTLIGVHLSAAFHTARLTLPQMKQRGWGRIIFTSSAHGLVASVNKAGYVAAKHGMLGLCKVIALETAGTGVTCVSICPGWVRTPLVERQIEALAADRGVSIDEAARELLVKQPSRQFVNPEDLGQLLIFLCSRAAAQITGTSISMDGGWCAQ